TRHTSHRNFSTPAYGSSKMGSVPEEPETTPANTSKPTPATEGRKPSFTYQAPPPPPPPTFSQTTSANTQQPYVPPSPPFETNKKPVRKPLPRHNTTYMALTPYLSHEGRVWVGPGWEWKEPLRRRSKWWAGEF
ncbi:hypothetical protein GQ44DRAFT_617661, partial [Phaeosphaeriaceae sp. PMI808]